MQYYSRARFLRATIMVIVLSPCRPRRLAALGLQRDQKSGSILALPLVASYHCRIPLVRYPWRRGASRDTSTWLMIATESHAAHSSPVSLSFSRLLPSPFCLPVSPCLSRSLSSPLFRLFLRDRHSPALLSFSNPWWCRRHCCRCRCNRPSTIPGLRLELLSRTFFFLSSFTGGNHGHCWLFDAGFMLRLNPVSIILKAFEII